MDSKFKIDKKRKIIIEILSSDITTDEYIKLKHDEFLNENFSRKYNLVADFRNCEANFEIDDLQDMINIFRENKGKTEREKSALVFSNTGVLKRIDLSGDDIESKQKIEVFTDIDSAVNWASEKN